MASSLLSVGAGRKSNDALRQSFTVHRGARTRKGGEVTMLMEKQKKQTTSTLMTVKDVATYLAVTERTVYRLVKDHKLPAYKVGGQCRGIAGEVHETVWPQAEQPGEGLLTEAGPRGIHEYEVVLVRRAGIQDRFSGAMPESAPADVIHPRVVAGVRQRRRVSLHQR